MLNSYLQNYLLSCLSSGRNREINLVEVLQAGSGIGISLLLSIIPCLFYFMEKLGSFFMTNRYRIISGLRTLICKVRLTIYNTRCFMAFLMNLSRTCPVIILVD